MKNSVTRLLRKFVACSRLWNVPLALKVVVLPKLLHRPGCKHKAILAYLEKHYADVVDSYRRREAPSEPLADDCPIWVCWFQGEESAPPIVRKCIESIRRNSGLHPVNMITYDNYGRYVSIPRHIVDKVENKEITLTHFSDILRCNLLADYGGVWLDATIYLTDRLKTWNLPFFTIKQDCADDGTYVSAYRWTSFCIGGCKGNVLASFLRDMFNEYHKREKGMIDYYLIDYVIAVGYNSVPAIKKLVDGVPCSNPDLYYMTWNMSRPVDEVRLKEVCRHTSIFKLGYRDGVPDDKNSLYHYIVNGNHC